MRRHIPIIILLGCVAAFAFGLVNLFELRFEAGDVYPPYSSLRSDPLGTMALYESLGKLPDLSVRRDFSTANRLPDEPHTVYLHLAGDPFEWDWVPADLYHGLEGYLARGNRLVIAFFPQTSSFDFHLDDRETTNSVKSAKAKEQKMTPEKPVKKKKPKPGDEDLGVDLADRWGFGTDFQKLKTADDVYEPVRVTNRTELALPKALDWHSGLVFTNLDPAWRVIYARGTNAVIIERHFGKGSVVMATDSFFASNEAMEKDRHAELLAWLVGDNKNVVFDEAHLGVVETSGVAVLMRKYRLHGLAAGLLLLAGLFIWRNSSSLVPPHAEEQRQDYIAGKDASAGFVNLLRRNIAPRDLLATCFAEWKKSVAPGGTLSVARLQQAEAIFQTESSLPAKDRNPVAAYRKISQTLHRQ